jgi:predicted small lipoprotein YifL
LSLSPKIRAAFVAAAALVVLAACGRRGELEPPQAAALAPANPRSVEIHRADPKITPPNKDFVLDPLLK